MGTEGLDPSFFTTLETTAWFTWEGRSVRTAIKGTPSEVIDTDKPIKRIEGLCQPALSLELYKFG